MAKSPDAATRMEIATALKAVDPATFGGIDDLHEMHKASLEKWAHDFGITDVDNPLGSGGGTPMSDAKLDEIKRILEAQGARQERMLDEMPDRLGRGMVDALRTAGVIPPAGTPPPVSPPTSPPPPITAGAPIANVSRIVGKTLDEADDLLPPGYAITAITRNYHRRVLLDDIISYAVDGHNISVVVSDGPDPDVAPLTATPESPRRPLERVHAEPVHADEGHDDHATTATPASDKPSFGTQVLDGATLGISRGIRGLLKKRGSSADS